MHRIYQSRRNLTASIASAAKAEDELLEAATSATTTTAAGASSLGGTPQSSGEANGKGRKRQFEDAINDDEGIGVSSEQGNEAINSEGGGQGRPSASSSSPHKKAATLRSPDATLSTTSLETTPETISDTPSDTILDTVSKTINLSTSTARTLSTNGITTPKVQAASITPTASGEATLPTNADNIIDNSTGITTASTSGAAFAANSTAKILSPDRAMVAIDLRTPSPSSLCADSGVTIVDPHPHPHTPMDLESTATTSNDQREGANHQLDDEEEGEIQIISSADAMGTTKDSDVTEKSGTIANEENEEEIEVISSTTINPNIHYPHKRTDCGLFDFSVDPKKFCEKCYCVVCQIPAKECKQWGDHSSKKCLPVTKCDNETTDDEGYDVTDEILLESPTTTARNYYNRRLPEPEDRLQRSRGEGEGIRRQLTEAEKDKKLRIIDVLARKLRAKLSISEGGRMLEEETHSGSTGKKKKGGKSNKAQQRNAMEGDIRQLGLHSAFFVEGIKIGWPFPAIMLPQRQMAMHIIKGLKRKMHVVVESPTGTGKSVAILCSVLAWQRYHMQTAAHAQFDPSEYDDMEEDGKKCPKIIYCSRTHSQVTQMVGSLKKTPYRPTMTILGSRNRLCIHKALTGENMKKNKMPLNQACQIRRLNTESDRKQRLKNSEYNDNDPRPYKNSNGDYSIGDDIAEGEIVADEDGGMTSDVDDTRAENGASRRQRKPKATCPHFRQLSSERVVSMTVKRFVGGHRLGGNGGGGCCGSSSGVGGEESAFGVHDMEDLMQFGKNPFKEENIAIYRGNNGKFGFLVNNNMDENDEPTRGCHVVSLVDGGAAAFEARLEDGDKILKINGKDVRTWNKKKVVKLLSQTPKNQPARLIVMRECSDTLELLDPESDLVGIQDIDNISDIYSESSVCPYYLSRAMQAHAELTFAPYNYILDPGIRRAMNINLKNAVVVLDEAHNVESTLCEGGSGKYGEIDLCQLVCTLGFYSRRTLDTGSTTLINTQEEVDTAKLAHDLLMFVESIILHVQTLRERFETSPGRTKMEADYKKYHNTPDNHEVELSYDGPTGFGIKGSAVGCQPFLTRLGITKERCARLLEFALSLEQTLFGGKSEDKNANQSENAVGESSNVLTVLVELLSKLVTATENAEHYYIACVVQANGNLDHAFGIEDEYIHGRGTGSRRFKKKPRMVPFMNPRTPAFPTAALPLCQHDECNPFHALFGAGVRHGDYCNGSTPLWECHLVLRLLSPGLLMREISQQCRSVILASGSLAPLPSVCAELNLFGKDSSSTTATQNSIITGNKIPEISHSLMDSIVEGKAEKVYTNRLQTTPKPLEANHVINLQKQLFAVSIGHFPTGEKLTVSYSNYHNNPSFLPKFGHAVASVIEGVPKGGCLVFFPSYSFLKKCVSCWNADSHDTSNNYNSNSRRRYFGASQDSSSSSSSNNNFVWQRLLRSKGKVIVEPTGGQEEFEIARDDYKDTIRNTGSCILLAVFRGKMSEGISFDDENSRAVICIGMPLPSWTDRSVKAKQAYNDEQRKLRKKTCLLPGRDFYSQQAYRAIAQALGRCIRHGADYGTVILMDSRHCHDGSPTVGNNGGVCRAHSNLPKWMRGSVHTLSMEREDHRVMMRNDQHQPKMIYGGYGGLKREMRQFFTGAPVASREVLNKWKADRERAISASSRGSNVVFHRDTGNWTTIAESSSQAECGGNLEQIRKAGIQI